MSTARILAAAALAAAAMLPAAAQNVEGEPNYGTINLTAGFTPDPQVMAVESGGPIGASTVSSSCTGFISDAPDVRLNYNAGSLPLILSVAASVDTTLVVNAPDGSWYCDDDGGERGMNPMVRFDKPSSGRYEIWVGTYGSSAYQRAELHISELTSQ
jgi:hypothetical protein